ncbi:unnamed protein product [Parnassius apollo]|uniref:(apollo) hypothetical protein n=1 Tax=Parnassius apollo TaxID=110799 RepID=A0A8S3Y3L2_PARAO|nr:unnamed protein product [Parnassius apollo]
MACFSYLVENVCPVPVGNVATLGAAVGAFNSAIRSATFAKAGTLAFKHVADAVKRVANFIGSKTLNAIATNGAFTRIKGAALAAKKAAAIAAVQGAVLGTGAAIGAAVVAHKPYVAHNEEKTLPWLHHLLHVNAEPQNEEIFAEHYELPDEELEFNEEASPWHSYPPEHFEAAYR